MDDDAFGRIGDDDLSIPRATVNKMLKELISHLAKAKRSSSGGHAGDGKTDDDDSEADGGELKIANEVRDLVAESLVEFVKIIAGTSQEICEREKKKMVTPQHVFDTLKELGFTKYLGGVKQTWDIFRLDKCERVGKGSKKNHIDPKELEEKMLEQERLFEESRQRQGYVSTLAVDTENDVVELADRKDSGVNASTDFPGGRVVGTKRSIDDTQGPDVGKRHCGMGVSDPFQDNGDRGPGFTDPFEAGDDGILALNIVSTSAEMSFPKRVATVAVVPVNDDSDYD